MLDSRRPVLATTGETREVPNGGRLPQTEPSWQRVRDRGQAGVPVLLSSPTREKRRWFGLTVNLVGSPARSPLEAQGVLVVVRGVDTFGVLPVGGQVQLQGVRHAVLQEREVGELQRRRLARLAVVDHRHRPLLQRRYLLLDLGDDQWVAWRVAAGRAETEVADRVELLADAVADHAVVRRRRVQARAVAVLPLAHRRERPAPVGGDAVPLAAGRLRRVRATPDDQDAPIAQLGHLRLHQPACRDVWRHLHALARLPAVVLCPGVPLADEAERAQTPGP